MDTPILILLIIIFGGGLAVFAFFLIKILTSPRKIETLAEMVKQGRYHQAIKTAKTILAKDPRNTDAHYLLGQAYHRDDKIELALMEYKTANQIGDFTGICDETTFRGEMASLYELFGQDEEALKEYLLLTKLEPYVSQHYYDAGRIFEKRRKGNQAVAYFKKALEANPRHSDSWYSLGHLLYRSKRSLEAKEAFEKAIDLKKDQYKAFYYLGKILKDGRNFAGALNAFESSQKDPEFKIRSLIERGACLLALHDNDKAVVELERAIKLAADPEAPEMLFAHYFLSIAYEKTRDLDKAIDQWEYVYTRKANFRNVAEKLSQYQELRADDSVKDFITASEERFEKICQSIADAMDLSVSEITGIPDGCQLTAVDRTSGQWRNIRKFPKMVRILRSPEDVDLPQMRGFHEEMRKVGITRGAVLTSSRFSRSAFEFAESRPIDLLDREKLQELLKKAENVGRN